jgi:transcriptional regulator with XRE-family HTH domain
MSNVTALPVQQSSFADEVAANIRAEAARRGVLQSQIAAALGLSQSGISGRYRGRIEWSLNEIEAVAHILGTTTSDLLVRHQGLEPRTR